MTVNLNSKRSFKPGLLYLSLTLCIFAFSGCRVGPKYVRPVATTAPSLYKENQPGSAQARANGWKQADPRDAMLRGKWWEVFHDPQLNALEDKVLIDNQNLKQYFENYMAARALVRSARASLYPTISIAPTFDVQGAGKGSNSTATTTSTTGTSLNTTSSQSYSLPLSASWEPDLFGKIRNTIREDANAAQVSAANLANETLSEQASLAEYYFELRGQDSLQQLYDSTIVSYRESLRITKVLFKTGVDSQQDVAQAETNLRTAEASAVAIGINRGQYEHAIALLTGQPAGSFSMAVQPLDAKPPYVPTGVPSALLERRPDIAAAERTMAEANALVGVGKAAYYPTISLSASGGTETSAISKLLNYSAYFWSAGGTASQTLFDFGARKANVQQYEAQYNAGVASYRQTVLNAFKEVEDYLVSSRLLAEQAQRQQLAIEASQQNETLADTRYKMGLDPYLDVLTAQNSLLANRETLVTLKTSQMTASVQLIAALGGGWNASELPSESAVAKNP